MGAQIKMWVSLCKTRLFDLGEEEEVDTGVAFCILNILINFIFIQSLFIHYSLCAKHILFFLFNKSKTFITDVLNTET